jgi:hypothetical protein
VTLQSPPVAALIVLAGSTGCALTMRPNSRSIPDQE